MSELSVEQSAGCFSAWLREAGAASRQLDREFSPADPSEQRHDEQQGVEDQEEELETEHEVVVEGNGGSGNMPGAGLEPASPLRGSGF